VSVAARKTTSPARTRSESTAEHHRVRRQQHETEAAQDYCEAIAELLDAGVEARVGRIAERFGLSHVTVSRVVRRLAVEGFVLAQPHKPLGLTTLTSVDPLANDQRLGLGDGLPFEALALAKCLHPCIPCLIPLIMQLLVRCSGLVILIVGVAALVPSAVAIVVLRVVITETLTRWLVAASGARAVALLQPRDEARCVIAVAT
jgi:hypothetical protein